MNMRERSCLRCVARIPGDYEVGVIRVAVSAGHLPANECLRGRTCMAVAGQGGENLGVCTDSRKAAVGLDQQHGMSGGLAQPDDLL